MMHSEVLSPRDAAFFHSFLIGVSPFRLRRSQPRFAPASPRRVPPGLGSARPGPVPARRDGAIWWPLGGAAPRAAGGPGAEQPRARGRREVFSGEAPPLARGGGKGKGHPAVQPASSHSSSLEGNAIPCLSAYLPLLPLLPPSK